MQLKGVNEAYMSSVLAYMYSSWLNIAHVPDGAENIGLDDLLPNSHYIVRKLLEKLVGL